MFSFAINHINNEKQLNEVLLDVHPGKHYVTNPNKYEFQSEQKDISCWYYAYTHIRPRYGNNADALHPERIIEKSISTFRKKSSQIFDETLLHQAILTGYLQLFGVQQNLTHRLVAERLTILQDYREKTADIDKQMKEDIAYEFTLSTEFMNQNEFDSLESYMQNKILKKENLAYENLYKELNVNLLAVLTDYYNKNKVFFVKLIGSIEFEKKLKNVENFSMLSIAEKRKLYECAFPTVIPQAYKLIPSYWHPIEGIDSLCEQLRQNGAMAVAGHYGESLYNKPASILDEKFGENTEIYGWNEDEYTTQNLQNRRAHQIVIIGARKDNLQEHVYFIDPLNKSDPTKKRGICKMSFELFREKITDVNCLYFTIKGKSITHELKGPFGYHPDGKKMQMSYQTFNKENVQHPASPVLYTSDTLREILNNKIKIDSSLANDEGKIAKEIVINKIIETTIELPVSLEQISRVVASPTFSMICTSSDYIKKIVGDSASAYFSADMNCIYFCKDNLNSSLINHEFRHADCFLRHKDSEKNAIFAFCPISINGEIKNIEKYINALDKGDERIKRYILLWRKNKLNQPLSEVEMNELNNYEEAAKTCLTPLIYDINSLDILPILETQGIVPGKIVTKGLEKMRILSVQKNNDNLTIIMEPVEAAFRVFQVLDDVKVKLNNPHYSKKSFLEKLFERDAYTFQRLSKAAIATFYPEAQNLIDEDIKFHNERLLKLKKSEKSSEVSISKQNIFQNIDRDLQELNSLSKPFNDKTLNNAIAKSDFSLALKRAAALGGLVLAKNIIEYVEKRSIPNFNINAPSGNGNTALDWAEEKITHFALKQEMVAFLTSKGAISGKALVVNSANTITH